MATAATNRGVALLAASFLTSNTATKRAVAADYEAWIDEQAVEADACDALLGAARSSKNPDMVLANAAALYDALDVTAVIESISPATGAEAGSTAVTITGLNLTGATGVTFDGNAATSVVVASDTSITCVTPAGTGQVDVVVLHPNGNATEVDGYTYV